MMVPEEGEEAVETISILSSTAPSWDLSVGFATAANEAGTYGCCFRGDAAMMKLLVKIAESKKLWWYQKRMECKSTE